MDAASGPAGAFAVLAALHYRAATGRGQLVELAQRENVLNHLGDIFVDCQLGVEPERMGNRDRWQAPQGLYPCRGEHRWLAVSVADDEEWRALAAGARAPRAGGRRPRFADAGVAAGAPRRARRDHLGVERRRRDAARRLPPLQAAGVPAGPLLDDELCTDDPQVAARGWLRPLTSADVGTHAASGPALPRRPPGLAAGFARPSARTTTTSTGRSSGLSDEDFARYRAMKILAEDYLDPDGNPY